MNSRAGIHARRRTQTNKPAKNAVKPYPHGGHKCPPYKFVTACRGVIHHAQSIIAKCLGAMNHAPTGSNN